MIGVVQTSLNMHDIFALSDVLEMLSRRRLLGDGKPLSGCHRCFLCAYTRSAYCVFSSQVAQHGNCDTASL